MPHPRRPIPAACRQALALLAGAGLSVGSTTAWAQAAAAAADAGTQTILVTSVRKKLETVQDVPATVSVLSGAELQASGVSDVKGIEYRIPGLVLGNLGFDGALMGLRGASSTRGFTGDEATVATHLDGVYVPHSGAALGRLFDVARVDTLYGPQGTLYGRNAVSGVIDLVSNAPADRFSGSAQVMLGSFSGRGVEGYVNTPLSAGSALRVAVSGYKDDGYVENVIASSPVRRVGTDEFWAGRVRYANALSAETKLDLIFQASKDTSLAPFQPRYLDRASARTSGVGWRQTAIDQQVDFDRRDSTFSIRLATAFGGLQLRSVTGYTTYEVDQHNDRELSISPSPAGLLVLSQSDKAFSQEFTLSPRDPGALDWRVGLYYTKSRVIENRKGESITSVFPGQRDYDDFRLKQDGDAKAVYASADWNATPNLVVTLGGRYNDEHKKQIQDHVYGNALPAATVPSCSTVSEAPICRSVSTGDFSWTGPSGDASVKWQLSRQTMAYARVARGFRSGAVGGYIGQDNYFDQLFGGPGTFEVMKLKPEKLDSIELGVKNTLMGGKLFVNAALYHNTFKDQLFAFADPVTFRFVDGNIGQSKLKGIDLAVAALPVAGLRIDAAVSYLDAKITRIDVPDTGINVGNKPILAPELSATLGVSYRFALAGGEMTIGGDYNYKDEMYQDLQNTILRPPVELFNLNASWTAPGGRWKVFASVNNLFDKEYLSRPANNVGAAPGPVFVGEPRKWRVGAAVNF